jgi:transcriptional regulator with XRE-family HTH domain
MGGEKSRTIQQVVADNILGLRSFRRLSQEDVALAMRELGYDWTRTTISELEGGARGLRVDELLALALVFGVRPTDLLDPANGGRRGPVAFGGFIPALIMSAWVHGHTIIRKVEGQWFIDEVAHALAVDDAKWRLFGIEVNRGPASPTPEELEPLTAEQITAARARRKPLTAEMKEQIRAAREKYKAEKEKEEKP